MGATDCDDCDCELVEPVIVCNDDLSPTSFRSRVTVPLASGQTVIVIVDGYERGTAGSYVLNITGP